jgi:hypothetical protein
MATANAPSPGDPARVPLSERIDARSERIENSAQRLDRKILTGALVVESKDQIRV